MASSSRKDTPPPLRLGPLILGGAGFSYQLVSNPHSSPAHTILSTAFSSGVRTIDTSPYYDPSEVILGAALSHPDITSRWRREDYVLMTKVGRIAADHFDYSDAWIRKSVQRSLERFGTEYLNVVFCHDVEFVRLDEAVSAVGTLFSLVDDEKKQTVRYVGISGYDLDCLVRVARAVKEKYGKPVDVVQNWAQLTLQNTRLETYGLSKLKDAGVKMLCSASPLAVGLLRDEGVPVGGLGDWHPAPAGLREKAQQAANMVRSTGEPISALALRYSMRKATALSDEDLCVSTITGVASMKDLSENIATAQQVVGDDVKAFANGPKSRFGSLKNNLEKRDDLVCEEVREILGDWIDYDLSKSSQ